MFLWVSLISSMIFLYMIAYMISKYYKLLTRIDSLEKDKVLRFIPPSGHSSILFYK